jgi:hypothetical protein
LGRNEEGRNQRRHAAVVSVSFITFTPSYIHHVLDC